MNLQRIVFCLATLGVAGCFNGLNGVKVEHDMSGDDLAMPPSNDDGGNLPGADLKTTKNDGSTATDCELPFLAILIASDSTSMPDQIMRMPLDGRPACKPLSLGGTLPWDLVTMGFLPPSTIAVGGTNVVYQIGPNDKATAPLFVGDTSYAYEAPVDNLFAIEGADGTPYLGVTYDSEENTDTGYDVKYLAILQNGTHVTHWLFDSSSGAFRISDQVRGVTTSPLDRKKVFVAKGLTDPYFAAAEITPPWDNNPVEAKTPYYQALLGSTGDVQSIRTLRTQNGSEVVARTAWTFRVAYDQPWVVYYVNDHLGGAGKDLVGPLTCDSPKCSTEQNATILDAVPDPMNLDAALAICIDPQTTSAHQKTHVVRMNGDGSCDIVLDGDTLLTGPHPIQLTNAIIEP